MKGSSCRVLSERVGVEFPSRTFSSWAQTQSSRCWEWRFFLLLRLCLFGLQRSDAEQMTSSWPPKSNKEMNWVWPTWDYGMSERKHGLWSRAFFLDLSGGSWDCCSGERDHMVTPQMFSASRPTLFLIRWLFHQPPSGFLVVKNLSFACRWRRSSSDVQLHQQTWGTQRSPPPSLLDAGVPLGGDEFHGAELHPSSFPAHMWVFQSIKVQEEENESSVWHLSVPPVVLQAAHTASGSPSFLPRTAGDEPEVSAAPSFDSRAVSRAKPEKMQLPPLQERLQRAKERADEPASCLPFITSEQLEDELWAKQTKPFDFFSLNQESRVVPTLLRCSSLSAQTWNHILTGKLSGLISWHSCLWIRPFLPERLICKHCMRKCVFRSLWGAADGSASINTKLLQCQEVRLRPPLCPFRMVPADGEVKCQDLRSNPSHRSHICY